jgi:hypothetical protein
MAQRGFPGIHAGAAPIQNPPRGLLEGASRTGPQQRTRLRVMWALLGFDWRGVDLLGDVCGQFDFGRLG